MFAKNANNNMSKESIINKKLPDIASTYRQKSRETNTIDIEMMSDTLAEIKSEIK